MSALNKAIDLIGHKALAEKLGVSSQALSCFKKTRVPAERCRDIEAITNGQVTAEELRPDVFLRRTAA